MRSVILLCAILPCDWNTLADGKIRPLRSADVDEAHRLRAPSVHAWSPNDVEYPGQSDEVYQMCLPNNRVKVLHTAGHSVPFRGDETEALAGAIAEMVVRVQPCGTEECA